MPQQRGGLAFSGKDRPHCFDLFYRVFDEEGDTRGGEISACRKEKGSLLLNRATSVILWVTHCIEEFRKKQRSGRLGFSFLEVRRRKLRFRDVLLLKCMENRGE